MPAARIEADFHLLTNLLGRTNGVSAVVDRDERNKRVSLGVLETLVFFRLEP